MTNDTNTSYRGFAWAGIYFENLAASIKFYKQTTGLELLRSDPHFAHFDAGCSALLELFSGGKSSFDAKEPARQSIVLARRIDDLATTRYFLEDKAVRSTDNSGRSANTAWATFVDPDGCY